MFVKQTKHNHSKMQIYFSIITYLKKVLCTSTNIFETFSHNNIYGNTCKKYIKQQRIPIVRLKKVAHG